MRAKTFLEANPSPAIFPLAVSLHGCCTSVVPQNCGGRTRTRRAFPRAINSRDRYQVTVYTTNESSRGWSRTSGLRVQSPAFVPTQTTREKDKLPRQESNLESAGSEPAALANYTTGHLVEPLGFEPRYRLCKSRVLPVRRRPHFHFRKARCRNRTDDSTLARSRDGPFTNRAKFRPTKNPETVRGFRGCCLIQEFQRTLPAQIILLVTARVGRGSSLVELGKCVEHGLHPPIRMTPNRLTRPHRISTDSRSPLTTNNFPLQILPRRLRRRRRFTRPRRRRPHRRIRRLKSLLRHHLPQRLKLLLLHPLDKLPNIRRAI